MSDPNEDFRRDVRGFPPATVVSTEGGLTLSRRLARGAATDRQLEDAFHSGLPVEGNIDRLATSIGLEHHLSSATGRMRLPDGSERFLVDERTLLAWTSSLGGTLADSLKTTNVQNRRCMTTWVMEK